MPSCSAADRRRRPPRRNPHERIPTTARRSTSNARSCATWPSGGSAAATCSIGSPCSAPPPRSPRSSPRARARPTRRPSRARSGGAAKPSSSAAAGPRRRRRRVRRRRHRPRATPPPTPEGELFIYNWAQYMGKSVDPVVREEVRRQGHDRLLRQLRHDARQDRAGRRRLRHHVPDLDRHPGPPRSAASSSRSTSRCCRTSATSAPSGRTRATTRATRTPSRTCGGRRASPTTPPRCRRS